MALVKIGDSCHDVERINSTQMIKVCNSGREEGIFICLEFLDDFIDLIYQSKQLLEGGKND